MGIATGNRKVSLKEIAKVEHVSIATVSMALSGKSGVSREVADRIKKTADQMGYVPPKREKRVEKRLGSIAILQPIDEFSMHSWSIFTRIIKQIEQNLISNDFFPVIIPINNIIRTEDTLRKLIEMNVHAVVSIHHIDESLFHDLTIRGISVIIINNSSLEDSYTSVLVDDFQGAYNSALELVHNGHKRILYVDYPRSDLPNITLDRRMGVQKASLEFASSGFEFSLIELPNYDIASIKQELTIIQEKNITALLSHDDYIAASIYMVLNQMGYSIPEDVSMISTGGGVLDYSIASTPQLSAYELDVDLIGQIAGEEILRLISSEEKDIRVLRTKQLFRDRSSIKKYI
ncbi:LacI family transcriptional regulator [Oceanispirochaeta crateris]|uniref:LacI family transcriptional regulator n=1 Tax=Oceanispirochaeta crateris TaxID=2518645 RepID=A0A5C1QS52_9SPIO|nr:LacI family DNA-binding transcriptional regulator [Oceanispirochaeta crateris]QEN06451.1 LacI family transcriptional regulator [Oceanispirochaeta crateris]QEN09810.1 LacI family transcriptional regulator [Oceanispirochaeta crateris]